MRLHVARRDPRRRGRRAGRRDRRRARAAAAARRTQVSKSAKASAIATVDSTLAGIPQSGNVLGNPNAPVTITEYGDLVCPTCAAFAHRRPSRRSSPALVKTGKAKLVYRAFETASAYANAEPVRQHAGRRARGRAAGQGVELHPADLRGAAATRSAARRPRRSRTSRRPTCRTCAAADQGPEPRPSGRRT